MIDYVLIGLICVIVLQNWLWHYERKDLYNRIMCRDINDYKRLDEGKPAIGKNAQQKWKDKWRHKAVKPE